MQKIIIQYEDYCEETNDTQERKTCKLDGPRYSDSEGYFRVPRTGFVRNGVEYQLRGFGKLDRPAGPKIEIPLEATQWLEMRLGRAYIPYFIRDRELRVKISTAISIVGWDTVKGNIEQLSKQMPVVQAVKTAATYSSQKKSEEVYELPPAGSIDNTPEDLEDMFK